MRNARPCELSSCSGLVVPPRRFCAGHWSMIAESLQRDIVDAADPEARDTLIEVAKKRIRVVERKRFRRTEG